MQALQVNLLGQREPFTSGGTAFAATIFFAGTGGQHAATSTHASIRVIDRSLPRELAPGRDSDDNARCVSPCSRLAAPLVAHADDDTLAPHPDDTRWWLSAQANVILQAQPGFLRSTTAARTACSPAITRRRASSARSTRATRSRRPPRSSSRASPRVAVASRTRSASPASRTSMSCATASRSVPTPYLAKRVHRSDHPPAVGLARHRHERDPLHVFRKLAFKRRIEILAGKLSHLVDVFDVRTERGQR